MSMIKFGIVFGIIFFLYYFFLPNTGLKTQKNVALVFGVHPALEICAHYHVYVNKVLKIQATFQLVQLHNANLLFALGNNILLVR